MKKNISILIIAAAAIIAVILLAINFGTEQSANNGCDCAEPLPEPQIAKINIPLDSQYLQENNYIPMSEYQGDLRQLTAEMQKIDQTFKTDNYYLDITTHTDKGGATIFLERVIGGKIYTNKAYTVNIKNYTAYQIAYEEETPEIANDTPQNDAELLQLVKDFENSDRYRQIDESQIKGPIHSAVCNRYEYNYNTDTLMYIDSVTYIADDNWNTETLEVIEYLKGNK